MSTPSPVSARSGVVRVPQPDGLFWVLKIITTGLGETASDFLVRTFAPELVVPVALLVLIGALVLQFRMRGYRPAVYWGTALMVSVFGTMAADVLHVGLGVPYWTSTAGFALVLAAVFLLWWRVERNLSVHEITTSRREAFYWAAVLSTFALGTAGGDLMAHSLGLGYLGAGFVFLLLFAVPGVVFAVRHRYAVATFWTAYVLTRPLGASFADWFGVARDRGGVGLGTGPVSLVLLAALVALLTVPGLHRQRDRMRSAGAGAITCDTGGRRGHLRA